MQPDFLNVQVGDVVAVKPPSEKVYLAQLLYVEGGARTADPYFLQVCREPDCAVNNICPSLIAQRLPRGLEMNRRASAGRLEHAQSQVPPVLFQSL